MSNVISLDAVFASYI